MRGEVKWFNAERGYGFIASENKDYFVHYSEIQSNGYKTLSPGDKVSFVGSATTKGDVAKNVQVEQY